MIKKIRFPLSLIITFVLLSCSSGKDEDDSRIDQEQLNAIAGTWSLVEYNVNPPQDIDRDGTASENLIDELECITGSLTFTQEFSWSRSAVQVEATLITGSAFAVSCGPTNKHSGDWQLLNNQILLEGGTQGTLQLSGNTLTRTLDEDLPGVRELVYQKQ